MHLHQLVTVSKGLRCPQSTDLTFTTGFNDDKIHAICTRPSEEFHFPGIFPVGLDLPTCSPSKSSRQTLANSGTSLGLAPHTDSLSRLASAPLLERLKNEKVIEDKIWSVTLLDTESGVISLGGTIAKEVEEAKVRGEVELKHFGDPFATSDWVNEHVDAQLRMAMPLEAPWDKHFKWTEVQGAAGWWTALMSGVWINGAKVWKIALSLHRPSILTPCSGAQESAHPLRH